MASYVRFAPLHHVDTNGNLLANVSNSTGGCPDGVQWIWHLMQDCADTPRKQASAYVGLVSMVTWMMVAIPQIIKNFMKIDGMAGVSFFLLFQWTAGDTTNLIGAILTNQLKPQIILACFFVASDCVLLAQYLAFFLKTRRDRQNKREAAGILSPSQLVLCLMGLLAFSQFFMEQLFPSSRYAVIPGNGVAPGRLSRSLLSTGDSSNSLIFTSEQGRGQEMLQSQSNFWHDPKDIVGYVIGVISSIFYLGSRTAQIVKNYKNASTEGLAVMTFILAVLGNLTYGGQILIESLEEDFLLQHTPWLVGSLGVIGLDCTLLGQFYHYSKKNRNNSEERRKLLNQESLVDSVEPTLQ